MTKIKSKVYRWILITAFSVVTMTLLSCNPFAPALDESATQAQFGDAHNIPGFFQAFKYAYEFRDTTTYGALIAPDFTFSYRKYDPGVVDITWGRDDEMRSTATLFENAERISLNWGDMDSTGTQTECDVTISFSLDITFNGDIEQVHGRAVFHLERASPSDIWRAKLWRDESNP
jgi:hypothetical protein